MPGVRYRDSGTLYAVGQNGYNWSSSIPADSSYALYLGFGDNWLNPQSSYFRASGRQVRCLLE